MSPLPHGWKVDRLQDVAHITLGQSPPGSSYNTDGRGLPFFQGKTEFSSTYAVARQYSTAGLKFATKDDVLLSLRAPVGPTNLAPDDCVIGRGLAAIRAHQGLSQRYLLWALRAREDDLAKKGAGSTFAAITGAQLRAFRLPIAPLRDQARIVDILEDHLSRLDAAVRDLTIAAHRADAMATSSLNQLFMAIPSHLVTTLGELVAMGSGGTPRSRTAAYYEGGTIPWVNSGDLRDGALPPVPGHITEAGLAASSAKWVPTGAVLIAMYGATIGRLGVPVTPVTTNQAIAHLIPDGRLDRDYLFWYLRSQRSSLVRAGKGGAQPNISQTVLKAWPVPVPPRQQQAQVVGKATRSSQAVDRLKRDLSAQGHRVDGLRKALLSAAFSGRLTGRSTDAEVVEELVEVNAP